MKTLEDYMNDPYIAKMRMPLREVHAIRLMIYDETKDMTSSERTAYFNESVKRARERGFELKTVSSAK